MAPTNYDSNFTCLRYSTVNSGYIPEKLELHRKTSSRSSINCKGNKAECSKTWCFRRLPSEWFHHAHKNIPVESHTANVCQMAEEN